MYVWLIVINNYYYVHVLLQIFNAYHVTLRLISVDVYYFHDLHLKDCEWDQHHYYMKD